MTAGRWLAAAWALVAFAGPCAAQTRGGSVLVKAGLNVERAEDGVAGESPALGAGLAVPITARWLFDFDYWHPAYFETRPGVEHRDILVSVGVRRAFGGGSARPFVAFGFGLASTQERRPALSSSRASSFLYVGGGVDVPLGERLAVVPELRLTLDPAFVIVRPSVGVAWKF